MSERDESFGRDKKIISSGTFETRLKGVEMRPGVNGTSQLPDFRSLSPVLPYLRDCGTFLIVVSSALFGHTCRTKKVVRVHSSRGVKDLTVAGTDIPSQGKEMTDETL